MSEFPLLDWFSVEAVSCAARRVVIGLACDIGAARGHEASRVFGAVGSWLG